MTLFLFQTILMECMWLSTFIPDVYTSTTMQNVMRIIGIVLGIIFFFIANHFEEKLKGRVEKLEDRINKEDK